MKDKFEIIKSNSHTGIIINIQNLEEVVNANTEEL